MGIWNPIKLFCASEMCVCVCVYPYQCLWRICVKFLHGHFGLNINMISFLGRGRRSHAYTHSVQVGHHVFLNLHTLKVDIFCWKWFDNNITLKRVLSSGWVESWEGLLALDRCLNSLCGSHLQSSDLTLKMSVAQVVEMSITTSKNSLSQDFTDPDYQPSSGWFFV